MSTSMQSVHADSFEDTERGTHAFRILEGVETENPKATEFTANLAEFHDRLVDAIITHRLNGGKGPMLLQFKSVKGWVVMPRPDGNLSAFDERIAGARSTARAIFKATCRGMDSIRHAYLTQPTRRA